LCEWGKEEKTETKGEKGKKRKKKKEKKRKEKKSEEQTNKQTNKQTEVASAAGQQREVGSVASQGPGVVLQELLEDDGGVRGGLGKHAFTSAEPDGVDGGAVDDGEQLAATT